MQNQKNRKNLLILVECAVMIGLATVLSMIEFINLPFGGSVTLFSMVPIIIIALRHGTSWGLICSFVYSNTQLLLGLKNLAWIPTVSGKIFCILFDYTIAFGVLGLAGLFKKTLDNQPKRKNKIILISVAVILVCVLRYISHNISAMVVWRGLLEEPETLWAYMFGTALSYNAAYMIPETIITLISVPAVVTILSVINKKREK